VSESAVNWWELPDDTIVRDAGGELRRVNRTSPREFPVLELWSDEYASWYEDNRVHAVSEHGDEVDVKPVTPLTVLDLTKEERSYLAMHAHYAATAELDVRHYMIGVDPRGGAKLSPEWATRQARADRWQAIADALHPDPWGTRGATEKPFEESSERCHWCGQSPDKCRCGNTDEPHEGSAV
jgi:hypothetical protein